MKKIIIFLMMIIGGGLLSITNVDAKDFYEGGYIDNIYMTKEKNGTRYYQKARFFNRASDNNFAYCIEPFEMFNENGSYTSIINPNNLTNSQKKRIEEIAYFGYKYKNHDDVKWYAITQLMIWRVADPSGNIYFTNTLDGPAVERFSAEINEINSLINNYNILPSISNTKNVDLVEGKEIILSDTNNVLSNYHTNNSNATISGNKLVFKSNSEGVYNVSLQRNANKYGSIPIYFHSNSSQDMLIVGDLTSKSFNINFNVKKTNLIVHKIDKDTKTSTSKGQAELYGAVYQLYDNEMNELEQIEIPKDLTATISNLNFGKYFLKEIKAGKGYTLDNTLYEFDISSNNTTVDLSLENKVIEKEVTLHKSYTDGITCNNEANISFNIFDSKNSLFSTITTDNNGIAKITLPYGRYIFKQLNTTDGYSYIADFSINVKDTNEIKKELYDYKIKVPNTNKNSNFLFIILIIFSIYYVKKSIFN